jgi:ferredoxin-nitrite reductase
MVTPMQQPSWDEVLKRNPVERLKKEQHPLDVLDDLPEKIRRGYEAVPEEDMVRFQTWGLYHDKPKVGYFMMRIKIANGILTPARLRAIGELSQRFSKNYAELSTRQNVQLHWIRLDDLPDVFESLKAAGLTTAGGCGDTVRNLTGCPLAGVLREELFDPIADVMALAKLFYGSREYSDLPRKHKITVAACPYQCNGPEYHDMAFVGAVKAGVEGYAVRVGGGLSSVPRVSKPMNSFVPRGELLEVSRAMVDVWKDNLKYRVSRVKARMKFMIDDVGPLGFRSLVEERLGRKLEDYPGAPEPVGQTDHLGLAPQKQEGLLHVGFGVFGGLLPGERMVKLADLVEKFDGDVRIARQQNIIITGVPEGKVEALVAGARDLDLLFQASRLRQSSVACTGEPYCNYSVGETKLRMMEIVEELEAAFGRLDDVTINLDGCPHACGQHWIGDIGLQGTTVRLPQGGSTDGFDILLGGGLGARAAIGKAVLRRVPSDRVKDYIKNLVGAYLTEKRQGESMQEFWLRHSPEELVRMATPAGGG